MNTELLTADLLHYGVAGMEWYKNKADRFQYQAKYARGAKPPVRRVGSTKKYLNDKDLDAIVKKHGSKALKKVDPLMVNQSYKGDLALTMATDLLTLKLNYLSEDVKTAARASFATHADKMNDKRMSKSSVDETTGLRLKKKQTSPEDDMKRINPGYMDLNSNTKNNCMLCSTAYEMRRRGYDVAANKAGLGYVPGKVIPKWFPGATIKEIDKLPGVKFSHTALTTLSKEPNGSRGNFCFYWGKNNGHSIVYEVKRGEVIFRDCQSNTTYDMNTIVPCLKNCKSADFTRLDNVPFNPNTIKEAVR